MPKGLYSRVKQNENTVNLWLLAAPVHLVCEDVALLQFGENSSDMFTYFRPQRGNSEHLKSPSSTSRAVGERSLWDRQGVSIFMARFFSQKSYLIFEKSPRGEPRIKYTYFKSQAYVK